jgi:hypothetical protein
MSILLAVAALRARPQVHELSVGINALGERLDVTIKPHVEILEWSISGSSLVLLIAAALLAVLFVWIAATG